MASKRRGEIDIHIRKDGSWWHEDGEIKRIKLVQLFSRLLAYRDGEYWLVTPAEMLKIQVDELPFLCTYGAINAQGVWEFRTACGHPLSLLTPSQWRYSNAAPRPELHIRDELWAGLSRQVYYDMAVTADATTIDGKPMACIYSNQQAFVFGQLEE